ncbi:MAG: hypothetical protein EB045_01135 [Actinobacteria bacterium]|nr:hypothetical protein [Actinomycetota bacterium]
MTLCRNFIFVGTLSIFATCLSVSTSSADLIGKRCQKEGITIAQNGSLLLCKKQNATLLWSKTKWRTLLLESQSLLDQKFKATGRAVSASSLREACTKTLSRKISAPSSLPIVLSTSVSKKTYRASLNFFGVKTSTETNAFSRSNDSAASTKQVCIWKTRITLVEIRETDKIYLKMGTVNVEKTVGDLTKLGWIIKLNLSR